MRPDTSGWRSSPTYDYVDDLRAPDLAWEWLRRNADYQRDYALIGLRVEDQERLTKLVRQRWGLLFPSSPNFECYSGAGVLDTGNRSGRHRHYVRAVDLRARPPAI